MNEFWAAALNLVSAAVASAITWLATRRKVRADAEGAIAIAAKDIVEAASRQLDTTEARLTRYLREHENVIADMASELRVLRARVRELETTNAQTLASVMSIATAASEQVAKLTILRDTERETILRELSRLHALAGMRAYTPEPIEERQYRARERFNGG